MFSKHWFSGGELLFKTKSVVRLRGTFAVDQLLAQSGSLESVKEHDVQSLHLVSRRR